MSGAWPRVAPAGDRGLLVEFAPVLAPETNALVRGADAALAGLPGVTETVPAFRSVLVVYDPLAVAFDELAERAEACARAARPAPEEAGALVEVPVAYGGASGPDLEAVAHTCGLEPDEVVRIHGGTEYLVFMLGFAPGYPYLGLLPSALRLPRRATPRTRVPPGSVAIADAFSGIYPQETAGGWHLLGRTPLRLFDPDRDPPCLLRPGDRVRFVPLDTWPRDGGAALEAAPAAPSSLGSLPARPAFEVLEPGLMTTVQDRGREGWRRIGVPSSGALDRGALEAVNSALGNLPGAAAIELAFPGPRLRALAGVEIVVAGADLPARVNGAVIEPGEAVRLRPGDEIGFDPPRRGQWLYLGASGGIAVPLVLGSRATYPRGGLGGHRGRALRAGDILGLGEASTGGRRARRPEARERPEGPVRVVLGPQAGVFTDDALAAFLGRAFQATVLRDRSGARLAGPVLNHRESAEILSDGLLPGAIQVPADGQPMVILADGPTTGGYAKIAAVIGADLDRVAQAGPGTEIRFEAVTVAAAHAALREQAAQREKIPPPGS